MHAFCCVAANGHRVKSHFAPAAKTRRPARALPAIPAASPTGFRLSADREGALRMIERRRFEPEGCADVALVFDTRHKVPMLHGGTLGL